MYDLHSVVLPTRLALSYNKVWLGALAPSKDDPSSLDYLVSQLAYMHFGMKSGDLDTVNKWLSFDDAEIVKEALAKVKAGKKVKLSNPPDKKIEREFKAALKEGEQLADSMLDDEPRLLYAWMRILNHHSNVTEGWLSSLGWFESELENTSRLGVYNKVVSLGKDFSGEPLFGGVYPFRPEEHGPWLLYYAMLAGFSNRIKAVWEYVSQNLPMRNRIINYLGIKPDEPITDDQKRGIALLAKIAHKYAYLSAAAIAFEKDQLMGLAPESIYQNVYQAIFSRVVRHDRSGVEFRRGNALYEVVWQWQYERSRVPSGNFHSKPHFVNVFPTGNTELAFKALSLSQVLLVESSLSVAYWKDKTSKYYPEAAARFQLIAAESLEVANQLGWINKYYNESGEFIAKAPLPPFWDLTSDKVRGNIQSQQLADLYMSCQLFETEEEKELFDVVFQV